MAILVPQPWRLDLPIISGAFLNCSAIRWLPLPGSSQSKQDVGAKERLVTLPSQNDREDVLASILCLTLLCPNDREDALASSLEHVHRLVGLYQYGLPKGKSLSDFLIDYYSMHECPCE